MKRLFVLLLLLFSSFTYADTINLHWLNEDGSTYQNSTCVIDSDLILPATPPTKYGYTFTGWNIVNYTPIEYLESTGTQWIDTGYIPNYYTHAIYNGIITSGGAGTDSGGLHFVYDGKIRTGGGEATAITYNVGSLVTIDMYYNSDNNRVVAIGNQKSVGTPGTLPDITMAIFALHKANDSLSFQGTQKIYGFKIYYKDILVRDFIPVLDGNNVPCMFDRVEGKFYYNQGTGNFIAGPVISE